MYKLKPYIMALTGSCVFNRPACYGSDVVMFADPNDYFFDIETERPRLISQDNNTTILMFPLNNDITVNDAARIEFVIGYDQYILGGKSRSLYSFWNDHGNELMEISPIATYLSAIRQSRLYLDSEINNQKLACSYLAMIDAWCDTGSFKQARYHISETWNRRFYDIVTGIDCRSELKDELDRLSGSDVVKKFQMAKADASVFDEYKTYISKVLSGRFD